MTTVRAVTRLGHTFTVDDWYDNTADPGSFAGWDFWTQYSIGRWEPATFGALAEYLTPTGAFFDIGAWVGPVSLVASRLCRRVVAVEPDAVAHRMLFSNNERNRCEIEIHRVAIAEQRGMVTLHAHEYPGDSRTSRFVGGDPFEVYAVTIDDLRPEGCELMKMDVEGAEAWLLDGYELRCPLWLSTHQHLIPGDLAGEYDALIDDFLGRHTVVRQVGLDVLVEPR